MEKIFQEIMWIIIVMLFLGAIIHNIAYCSQHLYTPLKDVPNMCK